MVDDYRISGVLGLRRTNRRATGDASELGPQRKWQTAAVHFHWALASLGQLLLFLPTIPLHAPSSALLSTPPKLFLPQPSNIHTASVSLRATRCTQGHHCVEGACLLLNQKSASVTVSGLCFTESSRRGGRGSDPDFRSLQKPELHSEPH